MESFQYFFFPCCLFNFPFDVMRAKLNKKKSRNQCQRALSYSIHWYSMINYCCEKDEIFFNFWEIIEQWKPIFVGEDKDKIFLEIETKVKSVLTLSSKYFAVTKAIHLRLNNFLSVYEQTITLITAISCFEENFRFTYVYNLAKYLHFPHHNSSHWYWV